MPGWQHARPHCPQAPSLSPGPHLSHSPASSVLAPWSQQAWPPGQRPFSPTPIRGVWLSSCLGLCSEGRALPKIISVFNPFSTGDPKAQLPRVQVSSTCGVNHLGLRSQEGRGSWKVRLHWPLPSIPGQVMTDRSVPQFPLLNPEILLPPPRVCGRVQMCKAPANSTALYASQRLQGTCSFTVPLWGQLSETRPQAPHRDF